MKKHLLLGLTIGISAFAFAQNIATLPNGVTPPKINPAAARQAFPYQKNQQLGGNSFETMVNSLQPNLHQNVSRSSAPITIGTTQYQMQSNASICNRIVKNPDGTISATWTMAQDPTWTDRGTGYNYFDNTTWGTAPTVRIEGVRTGFVNIGVTNAGAEVVVSHETAVAALHIDTRATKGTGAWTDAAISGLPDTWARLAVGGANGHTLHVISNSGLGGGTTMINYHGQTGSINYSRSLDGGLTWDILRYIIPAIDSSHYLGFGGDSYSIDSRGDTVAIAVGGFDVDVILLKSVDNGSTWTKTIVHQFPIPMYDGANMNTDINSDGVVDTIESNDASVEVLLDRNNIAHVWYGRMKVVEDIGGTALSYFPSTQGLMYWNENMGSTAPVMITSVLDLDYAGHPADGVINMDWDPSGTLLGFGSYQVSLTSHPSAGVDANNKIYLSYSGLFEGPNTNGQSTTLPGAGSATPGKSYRHTYLMRSDDGGTTWCPPIDITDPDLASGLYDNTEGVFGAVTKDVDGFVHLIVEEDYSVGHGVSTTTTPDPQTGPAYINYYKVPVNDLACGIGVNDKASTFNAINLFPNPANNSVSVKFNVNKSSKAVVKLYNVMGKEVGSFDNQSIANGTILNINLANYNSGIYFVNTLVDGKSYSQKLVVE